MKLQIFKLCFEFICVAEWHYIQCKFIETVYSKIGST